MLGLLDKTTDAIALRQAQARHSIETRLRIHGDRFPARDLLALPQTPLIAVHDNDNQPDVIIYLHISEFPLRRHG